MKNQEQQSPSEELLGDIYKNVTMGIESIITLMPKVNDVNFLSDLTAQMNQYQQFANEAAKRLGQMNAAVPKTTVFAKIPSEIGIHMNTMADKSTQKLAELMINGSTMGIINMKKKITQHKDAPDISETAALANDVVTFEEQNINKLKSYL